VAEERHGEAHSQDLATHRKTTGWSAAQTARSEHRTETSAVYLDDAEDDDGDPGGEEVLLKQVLQRLQTTLKTTGATLRTAGGAKVTSDL